MNQRAEQAQSVLGNPIFEEAWVEVENAIIRKWKECPIRDREGAHELRLMLKALADVRMYIYDIAMTGKMEQIQAEKDLNASILRMKHAAG